MVFTIRPYAERDAAACGECLYEGFFTAHYGIDDSVRLGDYSQVLSEKCNVTFGAEAEEGQVVGFVCGKYDKAFDRALANRYGCKRHYGLWCRMFLKYYLKRYKMSERFQKQWDHFSSQLQERDSKTFGACDLELVALASKAAYRKGLGTALVTQFLSRARADGADTVRLLTNTLASWEFYEKPGFARVAATPFRAGSATRTIIYDYRINGADSA